MTESNEPAWRTAISDSGDDYIRYRGYEFGDVVDELDFGGAAFLLARGNAPSPAEARVFNALLVSVIDHGISPSQAVTRYTTASGSPIQAAVGAGVLTIGDYHGGAGEIIATLLDDYLDARTDESLETVADELVTSRLDIGERVPGYGHPEHPDGDPRTSVLLKVARENDIIGEYTELALAVEESLAAHAGRELQLNINGIVAALLLDLGFDPTFARPLVIISRVPGLIAHALEEADRERRWRMVAGGTTYDGPESRTFDHG
jgi:citrate synthase